MLLLTLTLAASCAARTASSTSSVPPAGQSTALPDQNLNAVLWMQSALEYEASALQAYRTAQFQLDRALETASWTAAIEQTGSADHLPPAVILDVDETVLDNSFYQARMVRDGTPYSEQTWNSWVDERRATPIPGALAFTRYAAGRGVAVFYVTNRTASGEQATRDNLAALEFPLDGAIDTVLTRGERPDWQASAKGPRRAHIAQEFRVLLLIGDDLGDFVVDAGGTPEQRKARTSAFADRWGRQWIMLPNPTYGSWERAIVGSSQEPIAAKRQALRYEPQ
jgi:acid phosphatase